MKIVALADLHGDYPAELPGGDALVIAGDVLADDYHSPGRDQVGSTRIMRQGWYFDEKWVPWLREMSAHYQAILWVGGNHDFFLQAIMSPKVKESMPPNVHYLCEDTIEINGIRFHGNAWNETQGWAFCLDQESYRERLQYVPDDTDVFITHAPPYHMHDEHLQYYTSPALSEWIRVHQKTLKGVICGHVHYAYGTYQMWNVPILVASNKDERYLSVNAPLVLDIEKEPAQVEP